LNLGVWSNSKKITLQNLWAAVAKSLTTSEKVFNLSNQLKSVKIVITSNQNQIHGCCQEKGGERP
jgi:hypothetical protein